MKQRASHGQMGEVCSRGRGQIWRMLYRQKLVVLKVAAVSGGVVRRTGELEGGSDG